MQQFLQIVGVIALAFVALVVIGVLVIRAKIRNFAKTLSGLAESVTPGAITLYEIESPNWTDRKKVDEAVDAFRLSAFESIGCYGAREMPGLTLHAFTKPDESVYGIVYEHSQAGVWSDVAANWVDGRNATATNAQQAGLMDVPPGKTNIVRRGASVAELIEAFRAEAPDGERLPTPADGFVERFESEYAKEMEWRNSRGGPTMDEIRRVADDMGEDFSEETLALTHDYQARQAREVLEETLKKRFLELSGVSATEWEERDGCLAIVTDDMSADEVVDVIEEWAWMEERPPIPEGLSGREAFAHANAALPKKDRFTLAWRTEEPMAADFYWAPEDE